MPAVIVSIVGRKGGCGKTTLTISLAGHLALAGQRVLVIDLDSQASATRTLFGLEHPFQAANSIVTIFSDPAVAPGDVIHSSPVDRIDCIPSCRALEQFVIPHQGQDVLRLRPVLSHVRDDYDVILIDTPPNTNTWPTHAGLTISDWALTPLIPEPYGAHSSVDTLDVLAEIPHLGFLGFVLTMVERNTVTTTYTKLTRQQYKTQVCKTEIPKAIAFRNAAADRLPVTHLTPKPPVAKSIADLANELANRMRTRSRRAA